MKISTITLGMISLMTFTSCDFTPAIEQEILNKVKLHLNKELIIGDPLKYGIDNLLLFAIGSNYKPIILHRRGESGLLGTIYKNHTMNFIVNGSTSWYDSSAKTEYINPHSATIDIRNILFYDLISGQTYPLLKENLHILSFALHKEFKNPMILYRIVKNDFNNDSIFDNKDAVMLFTSDLQGKNLTQITPENEHFVSYTLYKETNSILIKTIIDSDADTSFTNIDETNFREMKLDAPLMAVEIFTKGLKDSLRSQLKIW